MSFPEITEIVETVREQRLSEIDTIGAAEAPLASYCPENALALARALQDAGFSPDIVVGAFETQSAAPPEQFDVARELGQHHFWVQVSRGGTPVHADISQESPDYRLAGEPFVREQPPEYYDTYGSFEFEDWMTRQWLQQELTSDHI